MVDPNGRIAATVLAALASYCEREGIVVDARLRLVGAAVGYSAPPAEVIDGPHDLGRIHESAVDASTRVTRGAWYTPQWLAEQLVASTVDRVGTVVDPACGGGVFLLAAADRLRDLGASPRRIVGDLLVGFDIDPVAVMVTEAALWLWSVEAGEAAVAGEAIMVGDPLLDAVLPTVDFVVGNPPFLGQLRADTADDRDRRAALRSRWGSAVQPYTDTSWLFLLAGIDAVRAGGAVTLVLPQSVLAARDAEMIRDQVDAVASLEDCWVDDGATFAASVHCCAPRLRRTASGTPNDWTRPLLTATGVPDVDPVSDGVLGDVATAIGGFRDEYYGLVDAVAEDGVGPQLVTSGAIDPLLLRATPTRFAKRAWTTPTIDPAKVVGRAALWMSQQAQPKLLVASQTRVLEAIVDPDGTLLGGVPVIVVRPHAEQAPMLWHLAAAIHAPVMSAWILRHTAGTALTGDACRPTAALIAALPLPSDRVAWDEAAAHAHALSNLVTSAPADDLDRRGAQWDAFAVVADRAYGVDDPELRLWWKSRLPLR